MISGLPRESVSSRDAPQAERREYIRYIVAGASTGGLSLAGCLEPDFETEVTSSGTGELSSHNIEQVVDKVAEASNQSSIDIGRSEVNFVEDAGVESSRLRAAVSGNDVGEAGKVASSSTVNRETFWKPPESGRYRVEAVYNGTGSFSGLLDCPEISGDKAMLFSSSHLNILDNPETRIASDHSIHLDHGDDGQEGLTSEVAKILIEYVVTQILRRWVGPLAGIIASQIVDSVDGYVSAAIDILTGDCYTFDLSFEYPNKSHFEVKSSSPATLSTTFDATGGSIYKIQFSPVVGCTLDSGVRHSHSTVAVTSEYRLEGISVRRV